MGRLSLKLKLISALAVILLTSFTATSFVNYYIARDAVREELLTSALPLTRDTIFSEFQKTLMRPIMVGSLMANDSFLRDWVTSGEGDVGSVVKYLKGIKDKYGYFATFFVSSKTMNYYYPGGVLKKVSRLDKHDIWFFNFLGTRAEFDLDVDKNEAAANDLTIFINYRLTDHDGNTLGITGVGLKMDVMAEQFRIFREKYNRQIYLVDEDGVIQAHSDLSLVQTTCLNDRTGMKKIVPLILNKGSITSESEFDTPDGHILLTSRYLPDLKWFLIVEQDEDTALGPARSNLVRTLVVGLIASLVIIVIITFTVNYFQNRLEFMAATDELTGISNRRHFKEQFDQATYREGRYGSGFSVVLMDLDGFKAVNDSLGHVAGDRVLQAVADVAMTTIRPSDLLARWGGDEFIVLVDGDKEQAASVAERLRRSVDEADMARCVESDSCPEVTLSLGIAEYRAGESLDALTARADEALYQAKLEGKNTVVMFSKEVKPR